MKYNEIGMYLNIMDDTYVVENNFIDNGVQAITYNNLPGINFYDTPAGGNYWSDFDDRAEGCEDTDRDGFCDAPYVLDNGLDHLPWTDPSGWVGKNGNQGKSCEALDAAEDNGNGNHYGIVNAKDNNDC